MPEGGLVDVLVDGHQDHAGVAQGGVDDGVVEAVAGQPVDLVDDAVLDRVGRDVVEHLLQGASVGGLGGLAGLDELPHDDCAEGFGLAGVGLALGRQGQALVQTVAAGLVLGGDKWRPTFNERSDAGDLRVTVIKAVFLVSSGPIA